MQVTLEELRHERNGPLDWEHGPMVLALAAPSAGRVSHVTGDHTSLLKLIENRFMPGVHLTKRDQYANDVESMFDFNNSPSLNTAVGSAQPPQNDYTP